MNNKIFKNISMSVKLYVANLKKHIYLTISVSISMLLFLVVSLYMDFDYATIEKGLERFQDNYIIVNCSSYDDFKKVKNEFSDVRLFYNVHGEAYSNAILENGSEINILYNVTVTENLVEDIYFKMDLNSFNIIEKSNIFGLEKYKIKYGRSNFLGENEIIISEEHAMLLGDQIQDALGQKIILSLYGKRDIYKVVGIYEQTLSESRLNKEYQKMLEKSNISGSTIQRIPDQEQFIMFNVFISEDSIDIKNNTQNMRFTMYLFIDSEEHSEQLIYKLNKMIDDRDNYEIDYQAIDTLNQTKEFQRSQMVINKSLIMGIVTIISGINIFGTIVNSVRDRNREIGIKKALGASDGDIMFGFVVENVINVFIAIVFALSIASIIFLGYGYYQRQVMFIDYTYVFYPETVVLFLIFSISSIFGFSLIPAYKASQVNVIESIRVD